MFNLHPMTFVSKKVNINWTEEVLSNTTVWSLAQNSRVFWGTINSHTSTDTSHQNNKVDIIWSFDLI